MDPSFYSNHIERRVFIGIVDGIRTAVHWSLLDQQSHLHRNTDLMWS